MTLVLFLPYVFLITHTLFSIENSLEIFTNNISFFKIPMDDPTIEARRIDNFGRIFKDGIPKNTPDINFCKLFKDFSKKSKKSGSIYSKCIRNYDFIAPIVFLVKEIFEIDPMRKRCIRRCSYGMKNVIFIFFAVKYPDLMREIPNRLKEFKIYSKLTNPSKFTKLWNQYTDDIQNFISTELNKTTISNEIQRDIEIENSESFDTLDFFDDDFTFDDSNPFNDPFQDFFYDNN